ncbi:MAG: 30S ribosome-binding factor RbfA [Clostridia bacterium]|nr:30S ribosome-binding factor RbfA [Clostridia bacterium]
MAGYKIDRTAEDIRRELAVLLRELKDPRVQGKMLTVVNVEVSSDLSFAKVYVSAMEGLDTAKTAVKGLTAATGYLRRALGQALRLRKTPELKFIADNSIEKGMQITRMMNDLLPAQEGAEPDAD